MVLERRGKDGEADLAALREEEEIVARDGALDGGALREKVGQKLGQRPRVQDAPGDPVGSDLGGLLEHGDRDLAERLGAPGRDLFLVPLEELGETKRAGKPRGPSADEDHVDFEDVPRLGHFAGALARPTASAGGSVWVWCFSSSR